MTPPTKPLTITDTRPRVLRGGGWDTPVALGVRAANRDRSAPASRGTDLGFRTVQHFRHPLSP